MPGAAGAALCWGPSLLRACCHGCIAGHAGIRPGDRQRQLHRRRPDPRPVHRPGVAAGVRAGGQPAGASALSHHPPPAPDRGRGTLSGALPADPRPGRRGRRRGQRRAPHPARPAARALLHRAGHPVPDAAGGALRRAVSAGRRRPRPVPAHSRPAGGGPRRGGDPLPRAAGLRTGRPAPGRGLQRGLRRAGLPAPARRRRPKPCARIAACACSTRCIPATGCSSGRARGR